MKQALSRIILSVFWIAALSYPVTVQALDPSLLVPNTELNSNVVQGYSVRFAARGSIWDPAVPVFNVDESLSVGPYGPKGKIGGIGRECVLGVCGQFGAELEYGLRVGAGIKLDAGVDSGSVDVIYPMRVYIEYPYWGDLQGGECFTIKTRYYVDGTASMASHFALSEPPFRASLIANTDFTAGIVGHAAVVTRLPDFSLFPQLSEVGEKKLFDLQDYFKPEFTNPTPINLPDPLRGIVTGEIRFPRLDPDTFTFGVPANTKALYTSAADDFLTTHLNVSSIISKSIIGVPLSDSTTIAKVIHPFYNILQLAASLNVGAVQELTFEPHPQITFDIFDELGGARRLLHSETVEAGQDAQICEVRVPFPGDSPLFVRPTITPDHDFKNKTSLQAGPSVRLNPFEIGINFDDIDFELTEIEIPDIRFNPFNGPFDLRFPKALLNLVTYTSDEFALSDPNLQKVTGAEVVITADTRPPRIDTVCPHVDYPNQPLATDCRKTIFPMTTTRTVPLLARRFGPQTKVLVNGAEMHRNTPDVPGPNGDAISFDIPGDLQQQEGTLRVQLLEPEHFQPDPFGGGQFVPDQFSNTVDLTILPAALAPGAFGPVETLQYPGLHHLDISASAIGGLPSLEGLPPPNTELITAGNGLMLLATNLQTVGSRVAPGSILLWNGIPLATEVTLIDSTETADGTLYFYDVTAAVPSSLQLQGGAQQLSFLNAGVNAPETRLSTPITIRYPLPVISDILTIAPQNAPAGGVQISVSGGGFTPDSMVYWDGAVRTTSYLSASLLLANLSSADQVAGNHAVYVVNPQPGGGQSNVFILTTQGPIALPFAGCAGVAATIVNEEKITAKGTCTLRPNSDGIDPRTEEVRLSAWAFSTTIPAGSFRLVDSQYQFKGVIDGVTLQVTIKKRNANRFDFYFEGKGAKLSGKSDVVFVGLYIGNDGDVIQVPAKFIATSK